MPRPYALQVLSRPTAISEDLWEQWYTEEHIRDLVYSGTTRTSSVYRATNSLITSDDESSGFGEDEYNYLAVYQSDNKNPFEARLRPDKKCKVREESEFFEKGQNCYAVGKFVPLDLQLVEVLGSYEHREDVAPYLLRHKIVGDDIENKIQFDHVNAVAGLKGYRRTLLYRPMNPTAYGAPDIGPYVNLLHEFDEEIEKEKLPAVKENLSGIEPTKGCDFSLQAYRLLESEGFGGRCRTPERMET